MATLDDLVAGETSEATALALLATGIKDLAAGNAKLQADLAAALAGTIVSPAVQAKIDSAFNAQQQNFASIQADIAALPAPAIP